MLYSTELSYFIAHVLLKVSMVKSQQWVNIFIWFRGIFSNTWLCQGGFLSGLAYPHNNFLVCCRSIFFVPVVVVVALQLITALSRPSRMGYFAATRCFQLLWLRNERKAKCAIRGADLATVLWTKLNLFRSTQEEEEPVSARQLLLLLLWRPHPLPLSSGLKVQ